MKLKLFEKIFIRNWVFLGSASYLMEARNFIFFKARKDFNYLFNLNKLLFYLKYNLKFFGKILEGNHQIFMFNKNKEFELSYNSINFLKNKRYSCIYKYNFRKIAGSFKKRYKSIIETFSFDIKSLFCFFFLIFWFSSIKVDKYSESLYKPLWSLKQKFFPKLFVKKPIKSFLISNLTFKKFPKLVIIFDFKEFNYILYSCYRLKILNFVLNDGSIFSLYQNFPWLGNSSNNYAMTFWSKLFFNYSKLHALNRFNKHVVYFLKNFKKYNCLYFYNNYFYFFIKYKNKNNYLNRILYWHIYKNFQVQFLKFWTLMKQRSFWYPKRIYRTLRANGFYHHCRLYVKNFGRVIWFGFWKAFQKENWKGKVSYKFKKYLYKKVFKLYENFFYRKFRNRRFFRYFMKKDKANPEKRRFLYYFLKQKWKKLLSKNTSKLNLLGSGSYGLRYQVYVRNRGNFPKFYKKFPTFAQRRITENYFLSFKFFKKKKLQRNLSVKMNDYFYKFFLQNRKKTWKNDYSHYTFRQRRRPFLRRSIFVLNKKKELLKHYYRNSL